tara:strand:+ start:4289 stop:7024 length:2736 start_codon:yes stop_codon:yes gene_type:complete
MRINTYGKIFLCVIISLITQVSYAQYIVQHQAPPTISKSETNTLEFIVSGVSQAEVQEALLFFRYDDGVGYQQKEVFYRNGAFSTDLDVEDSNTSTLEYYFQLTLISGETVFYPESLPSENPIRIDVVESPTGAKSDKRNENIDFTVLSPLQGETLASDKVLIAIALFYDIEKLEPGEFRIFVDDVDITAQVDTSAYYWSFLSREYRSGKHTIRLNYITEKETYLVNEWDFTVVNPSTLSQYTGVDGGRTRPFGNVELGARNQVIGGDVNNAYTGRTAISGNVGLFKYSVNGFLTSQESNRLQPQNRYGVNLQLGKWWKFQAGHVYPNMSRFTISGRRIYGINTELHLLKDNFNVQFIYGEVNRKIENLYTGIDRQEVVLGSQVVDTSYALKYDNRGKGAFKREIIGGRVALGNERKFQIGFQAMKVEDDTSSVFNARSFTDILGRSPAYYSNLDPNTDILKLTNSPNLLQVENGSLQGKGNFVAGTDLKIGVAQNKIRLEVEGVISALNNDIYGGALTIERAEDLGFEINDKEEDLLDKLSKFIIVNENMNILPLRIKNIDSDSSEADLFFPTSLLASNAELSFNYPRNNLRIQYRWVGPNYNSLANSTVRKDIAGFTISDRFRMLQNRLFVTLGYEFLEDNVTNAKEATTESITYRTNVSWYPISQDLPRVSLGMRYRTRDNGIARFNPSLSTNLQNQAVQNFSISGVDTLLTSVPKDNITLNLSGSITQQFRFLDIIHDASLSFSTLKTTDDVFAFGDVKSSAMSLNFTSRFTELKLRTQLGITLNNTQTGSGQSDFKIFGIYAGGSYFLLESKLNINARIAATNNRSKSRSLIVDPISQADGDANNDYFILDDTSTKNNYGTYVLQTGAQYNVNEYHSFLFDANLTNVSGIGNTNDRIVQLRYIFKF